MQWLWVGMTRITSNSGGAVWVPLQKIVHFCTLLLTFCLLSATQNSHTAHSSLAETPGKKCYSLHSWNVTWGNPSGYQCLLKEVDGELQVQCRGIEQARMVRQRWQGGSKHTKFIQTQAKQPHNWLQEHLWPQIPLNSTPAIFNVTAAFWMRAQAYNLVEMWMDMGRCDM
jgi:hypothetical protein